MSGLPLRRGNSGVDVLQLQSKLISAGWMKAKLPSGEPADDGDFGPFTERAVKSFQAYEMIHADEPGVVDQATWNALFKPSPLTDFQAMFLYIIRKQVGVREHGGNNHGPEVRAYLKSCGLDEGEPWCLAMVIWAANKTADELHIKHPLPGIAHCLTFLQMCRRSGWTVPVDQVRAGDILIFDWHKNGAGHAAVANGPAGADGMIPTIEGNSNRTGDRETVGGTDGVVEYHRSKHSDNLAGVVRIPV